MEDLTKHSNNGLCSVIEFAKHGFTERWQTLSLIVFMALLVGVWSVTTYNEKKLHLTQDKQGTSNN